MKTFILITGIALISCCSAKKSIGKQPDTMVKQELFGDTTGDIKMPVCMLKMINNFKSEEKQNPPRSIFSYLFEGKTVYYVTPPCCDFFSDLYDTECNLIGHPDGGFTGKGDGKMPDFLKTRSNEKLIWKDDRK